MPIVDRIDAFAYLVGFLASVTMPVQDPRGMEAIQRLQLLKTSLERVTTLVRDVCLRKREAAAKLTFTGMLLQYFNEDIVEWLRTVIALDMHVRRFAANFRTPMEAGQVCSRSFRGLEIGY